MKFRSGGAARALLAVGLAMVASPIAATVASAQTAGEEAVLGFYDVSAEANGIGTFFGDPASQPYPVAAGLAPHALAQLGAGPSGRALSSITWPGPLLSNAGSLANVIGTPLPPELVANANYPVRAEANAAAGARDEQNVGPMSAVVDGGDSTARTALSDFKATGIVSAARVVTKSRSYLEGGLPVAVAETELQGVEVGGQVRIETVKTIARGRTDGQEATTEQEVVVSGVTVGGQGATIDADGLHLGPETNPNPATALIEGAAPALEPFKMRAYVTEPSEQSSEAGAGSISTGAVVFEWELGDSGQRYTVVLGGASVALSATTEGLGGAIEDFGDAGAFDSVGGFGGGDSGLPSSAAFVAGATPSTAGALGGTTGGSRGGSGSGGGGATGEIVSPSDLSLASATSDRVPLGWMLIGGIGMLFIGSALHRMRDQALAAALGGGMRCPLERSPV